MEILRGYGIGTSLQILLQRYWDDKLVIPKDENGRLFRT